MSEAPKSFLLLGQKLHHKSVLWAFIFGAATVLGFAPFSLFFVPIITCALLFYILQAQTAKKVFLTSFVFSFGLLIAGTSWIYVSLHDFGEMHPALAVLATVILSATFALPPAIIQAVLARLIHSKKLRLLVAFPVGLALSDWCRGWFLTGFPWLSIGYSQIPLSPFSNYASVLGIYGVTLACTFCSGGLGFIFEKLCATQPKLSLKTTLKQATMLPAVVILLSIVLGIPKWTQQISHETTSVSLLQGNIAQDIKWSPEWIEETMMTYLDMIIQEKSELILLPETAIPLLEKNVPDWYWEALENHAKTNNLHILLGIPENSEDGQFYNSVIQVGGGNVQRYRKHHLVPFGDYFPIRSITAGLLNYLKIPMSNFSPGPSDQAPFILERQVLGVDICYEDVFGEELIRQLPDATVLANFTNDAWWGESLGPKQHLQIAQARSIETGRELLRVTNTGVTAVIDHRGYIVTQAPQFSKTVLRAEIHGRKGSTPYSLWGNLPFVILCLIILALCVKSTSARLKTCKR
ncbi:MAG: apolipoprotein N-acyltransferase [Proteobacteria bacterium]|nr:apolipoprotein N-acyltransferase [Pseudomonadota bacterium]